MKSIDKKLAKLLTDWVAARRTQADERMPSDHHWLEIQEGVRNIRLAEEALVKWVDENLLDNPE